MGVKNLFLSKRLLLFEVGVLLLLYSSSTYVRLAPVKISGVYVTADDPVLHVRITQYVLDNGHLPRNDSLAWYPWGQDWERTLPNFRYYLTAFIYYLFHAAGMGMSLYDFCVFFPAFFAPLAVFPMFLLVKQLKGWKSGLVAAGVLALSGGYLTRTIAGFYRHEHVGVPLLILCMYFFVRGMRSTTQRENLTYGALSGITLVLLTGTWSGFRFLLDGYAVYVFLVILAGRFDRRLLWTFVITDSLALASTFFWPNLSHYFFGTTEFAVAFIVMMAAILHECLLRMRLDPDRQRIAVVVLSAILFASMIATVSRLPRGRYGVVVNPLRSPAPGDVSQTVAEHAGMKLSVVGGKMQWPALSSYGMFLFLVPIALFLPFYGNSKDSDANRDILSMLVFTTFLLFLALDPFPALISYIVLLLGIMGLWYLSTPENRPGNAELMMIVFTLLSAYFFKNMIRLNILFSVFVAIESGLCVGYGMELLRAWSASSAATKPEPEESRARRRRGKRSRRKAKKAEPEVTPEAPKESSSGQILIGLLVVILLSWSLSGSYRSAKGYPLGLRQDWFEALKWIEDHSGPTDVIMSWWDYGYWIETYAHRPTIADGATTNSTQIRKLARAFITTESAAYEFCKEYNVRYVMIDVSDDFIGGKWTAMAVIAKQNTADYMTMTEEGKTAIQEKGKQCLLFRLASKGALQQPLPPVDHFVYRAMFTGKRGGRVIIYEFQP